MREVKNHALSGNMSVVITSGVVEEVKDGWVLVDTDVFYVSENMLTDGKGNNIDDVTGTYTINLLNPSRAFLILCERIHAYIEENGYSNVISESVAGTFSQSRTTNASGNVATWKDVFSDELRSFRKGAFSDV